MDKIYQNIVEALKAAADSERAAHSARYFRTGKGEYGEGDRFYGVCVPDQRRIAKAFYQAATRSTVQALLDSPIHEERLTGLFVLNHIFLASRKQGGGEEWVHFYLHNTDRVNNWDLVDSSAHVILGNWLEDKNRDILYVLAMSDSLWENRIALIATFRFIAHHDFADSLALCEMLLSHPHDLIHKAAGWVLREIWKKDHAAAEAFLDHHRNVMPRTMLRYAIEKMPEAQRKRYLLPPTKGFT